MATETVGPSTVTLARALRTLGAALAVEMHVHDREDIGTALSNLALSRGKARDQERTLRCFAESRRERLKKPAGASGGVYVLPKPPAPKHRSDAASPHSGAAILRFFRD